MLKFVLYSYYIYQEDSKPNVLLIFNVLYAASRATNMSRTERAVENQVHREYVLDVRIVELPDGDGPAYRFEAPQHQGITFEDADAAELYADVYFDVNGFEEAGTGERGVPPVIIQAGRDTLAAYFLTHDTIDEQWVGSFMGVQPGKVLRYASRVRDRAKNIRNRIEDRDTAPVAHE